MPIRKILPRLVVPFLIVGALLWRFPLPAAAAGSLTAQDYVDIQQLYARYYHTIDAGQSEAWANTFTQDGSFNTNTRGREALVAFIQRGGHNRPLRHLHSNLTITPSAEGANGSVYVTQIDITADPLTIVTYSRYDDILVKTSHGWRFKTRQRSSDTTIGRAR